MANKKCTQCGLVCWADDINCKRCGFCFQGTANASLNPSFSAPNQAPTDYFSQYGGNFSNNDYSEENSFNNIVDSNDLNYSTDAEPGQSNNGYGVTTLPPELATTQFPTEPLQENFDQEQQSNQSFPPQQQRPRGLNYGRGSDVENVKKLADSVTASKKFDGEFAEQATKATFGAFRVVQIAMVPIVLGLLGWFGMSKFYETQRFANESAVMVYMQSIAKGQSTLTILSNKNGCVDLADLGKEKLIDPELASGEKKGFRYQIVKTVGLSNGESDCKITATPTDESQGSHMYTMSADNNWSIKTEDWDGTQALIPTVPQQQPSIDPSNAPNKKVQISSSKRK